MLPLHVIPFPVYPVIQTHSKPPTKLIHDPPLAGLAHLSIAHSSMSVVPKENMVF